MSRIIASSTFADSSVTSDLGVHAWTISSGSIASGTFGDQAGYGWGEVEILDFGGTGTSGYYTVTANVVSVERAFSYTNNALSIELRSATETLWIYHERDGQVTNNDYTYIECGAISSDSTSTQTPYDTGSAHTIQFDVTPTHTTTTVDGVVVFVAAVAQSITSLDSLYIGAQGLRIDSITILDASVNYSTGTTSTTGCTVTPRTVITDAVFVSSTVAETDHAVWDAGTTYGIGDKRIKNHRIYESLRATNLNFDPVTDTSSPPYWLDTGPTNRWGMLDDSVSTLTTSAGSSMTIVLSPGRMDTLGLMDVDASSVRVQLSTVADGTFYDVMHSMTTRDTLTTSWYNYFYGGFINKTTLVLLGLPKAGSVTLTLTFAKSAGTVSCGLVTFGLASVIGKVQYGAKIGIIDYSRKETDAFGRTTLVQRTFAKTMDVALYLNRSQVDAVSRKLAEVRSTACLWVAANNDYDSLSVYGFFRDWSIGIEYFDGSTCNLTIEGLT